MSGIPSPGALARSFYAPCSTAWTRGGAHGVDMMNGGLLLTAIGALVLAGIATHDAAYWGSKAQEHTQDVRAVNIRLSKTMAIVIADQAELERYRSAGFEMLRQRVYALAHAIKARRPDVGKDFAVSLAWAFFDAGRRYGVDPWLLASMCDVESHLHPLARSDKDARGICQIMPMWVDRIEFLHHPADLDNWWLNIQAAGLIAGYYQGLCGESVFATISCYHGDVNSLTHPRTSTVQYVADVTRRLHELRGQ
jgi:hypothetical protein